LRRSLFEAVWRASAGSTVASGDMIINYYYIILLLFSLLIIFVSILLFTPLLWALVHIHLYFNIVYFNSTRRCWLAW
jgi:hypothetical protein